MPAHRNKGEMKDYRYESPLPIGAAFAPPDAKELDVMFLNTAPVR